MNRILHHTIALLLASVFLVSFTGMRLLVHHCSGCGTTGLSFDREMVSCCASESSDPTDENHSGEATYCCATAIDTKCDIGSDQGCCDFEDYYIKAEYQLSLQKLAEKLEVLVLEHFSEFPAAGQDIEVQPVLSFLKSIADPPPRLTGKIFVIYSHQIKIA